MSGLFANCDYICVLREKDRKTIFEKVEIPAPSGLIQDLNRYAVDDTSDILVEKKSLIA